MSKKPTGKSSEASDPQDRASVYDFLYHDARRVGSFLAQLDPDGHLQSVKKTRSSQQSQSETSTIKSSGGVPGIAQLGGDTADTAQDQHGQSSDRTYDPFWANAIALLDALAQRGLLNRNMHEARIGQFVLLKGALKVSNLKVVEGVLAQNAAPSLFAQAAAQMDSNQDLAFAVLKALPHPVQAHIITLDEPRSFSWMPLEETSLITPASTLMLQYNPWLEGQWAVLGIKDASADDGPVIDTDLQAAMAADVEKAAEARATNQLALLSELIAPAARKAMGRPKGLYGLTPVLIFREVA